MELGDLMILKLDENSWKDLVPLLKENILENYFNILGLTSENTVYKDIYLQYSLSREIESIIFLRKSATIKFYARKGFSIKEVRDFLNTIEYTSLIGPRSYCDLIQDGNILKKSKKMTELCVLKSKIDLQDYYKNKIISIGLEQVDTVIDIYSNSFKSFASKEVLEERIKNKRGRAFGIFKDKKLVSVAFTDFESQNEALIVGVATRPSYRNRGYGSDLVKYLSSVLQKEKKQVFLEYESEIAGNIYKKLGFEIIDSVYKYWS